MSHQSSGDRYPQRRLFTTPTDFPPLAFNPCRHNSTVNTPQQQYHHNFPKTQPTSNRSVRRDSDAYSRFHGGTADHGRSGVGRHATEETSVVSRQIQLFQAANPIYHLASSFACPFLPAENLKKPVGGFTATETGATGGTGVFLPVYDTRIRCTHADDLIDNKGSEHQGRDYDAIPIEKLLPSEWTY